MFKWWRHHSIFSTLTFFTFLIIFITGGPYLIDPCKKDETQKISGFYQSLPLQHLRPKSYEKCMKLPYDLYCPSTEMNNADYVCPYILCKKICTTKELLLYHLKATQHHAYEETDMISIEDDMHEDEEETLYIADGPCLTPDIEKYSKQPFLNHLRVTFFYVWYLSRCATILWLLLFFLKNFAELSKFLVSLLFLKWPQIVFVTQILNESLSLFTRWHGGRGIHWNSD